MEKYHHGGGVKKKGGGGLSLTVTQDQDREQRLQQQQQQQLPQVFVYPSSPAPEASGSAFSSFNGDSPFFGNGGGGGAGGGGGGSSCSPASAASASTSVSSLDEDAASPHGAAPAAAAAAAAAPPATKGLAAIRRDQFRESLSSPSGGSVDLLPAPSSYSRPSLERKKSDSAAHERSGHRHHHRGGGGPSASGMDPAVAAAFAVRSAASSSSSSRLRDLGSSTDSAYGVEQRAALRLPVAPAGAYGRRRSFIHQAAVSETQKSPISLSLIFAPVFIGSLIVLPLSSLFMPLIFALPTIDRPLLSCFSPFSLSYPHRSSSSSSSHTVYPLLSHAPTSSLVPYIPLLFWEEGGICQEYHRSSKLLVHNFLSKSN